MHTLGSKRITLKKKKNPSLWGRKWRILHFPTLSKLLMFQEARELISSLGATPMFRVNVVLAAEAVNKSRVCSRRPLRPFLLLLFTGISWQTRLNIPALLPDISRLRGRGREKGRETARAKLTSAGLQSPPRAVCTFLIFSTALLAAYGSVLSLPSGIGEWAGGCGILYE